MPCKLPFWAALLHSLVSVVLAAAVVVAGQRYPMGVVVPLLAAVVAAAAALLAGAQRQLVDWAAAPSRGSTLSNLGTSV